MENYQRIKIEGKEYYIIDSIQNLRAEDSFIYRKNKLKMFKGNGESRKYVGSYEGQNGDRLRDFFEYSDWGKGNDQGDRSYSIIQQDSCFFSKSNLMKYLYDARIEYQKQEQVYNFNIAEFYSDYLERISSLVEEKIHFSIYDVSDLLNAKTKRGYIRSDDEIWSIWRKIVLPKISYLSILKLISTNSSNVNQKPIFYFRILLDYQFRTIVHPQLNGITGEIIEEIKSKKIAKSVSRQGADIYRK